MTFDNWLKIEHPEVEDTYRPVVVELIHKAWLAGQLHMRAKVLGTVQAADFGEVGPGMAVSGEFRG